jgi:broad specificity phosphatase PhoE
MLSAKTPSKSSRLVLVAHAETDATRRAAFPDGEGLNQKGNRAARDQLSGMPKRDAAFVSPAPAARETASLLGVKAEVDEALRELDVGSWRGRSLAEIAAEEPDDFARWIADPTFTGHGGESVAALIDRVGRWIADRPKTGSIVVAVSHAAVLRAALVALLDAPASAFWRIDVHPLSMMTFTSDGRRWALREMRL